VTYQPTTRATPDPDQPTSDLAPDDHNVPMRIEMVATDKLIVDPDTVRTFSRRELKQATKIIRRAGVRIPLGVDGTR